MSASVLRWKLSVISHATSSTDTISSTNPIWRTHSVVLAMKAGQSWDNRLFSAEKRQLNRRELCVRRPTKPLRRLRYSEVPREGLEPSRPCGHRILSPARLPIPPPRHINVVVSDEFCTPRHCAKNAPMSKPPFLALRSMGRIIAGVSLETEAELLRYVATRWH